jgi:hypothetical protein
MTRICIKCNQVKELSEFCKDSRYKDGLNAKCKICKRIADKLYRAENLDRCKEINRKSHQKNIVKRRLEKREYYANHTLEKSAYDKIYRAKNSDRIREYKQAWATERKDDPIFKIKKNLRRRLHHALNGNLKADKTFNLLGCTAEFFKEYIESLWLPHMNWENYGSKGWHIDHIKMCCTFDLIDPDQQKECFHYTNLRPLWACDNTRQNRPEHRKI